MFVRCKCILSKTNNRQVQLHEPKIVTQRNVQLTCHQVCVSEPFGRDAMGERGATECSIDIASLALPFATWNVATVPPSSTWGATWKKTQCGPKPQKMNSFGPDYVTWVFGEGVDSARGVAAIVVWFRNSSCNSSCDALARNGRRTIAFFLLFRVQNSLPSVIGCVKGCSKHVSSVVAAAKYCSLTPCRFHPFSKHPSYVGLATWGVFATLQRNKEEHFMDRCRTFREIWEPLVHMNFREIRVHQWRHKFPPKLVLVLRTSWRATETRRGPTWNFHEKHRKNYPRPEILDSRNWPPNAPKIPKNYPQNTKCPFLVFFWYFSVFWIFFAGGVLPDNFSGANFWSSFPDCTLIKCRNGQLTLFAETCYASFLSPIPIAKITASILWTNPSDGLSLRHARFLGRGARHWTRTQQLQVRQPWATQNFGGGVV